MLIPPNGKTFEMTMVTIGRARNGKPIEEMITYDMADMARQLELGPPQ